MRNWPTRFADPTVIGALVVAGLATLGTAHAEIPRVVIDDSGPMGVFGGREYTWATGTMDGMVARADGSTGIYRVPVTLYYPDNNSNGFGFVDVVSNSDFVSFTEDRTFLGAYSTYYIGNEVFSDFLRTEGFTYLAVQWSRLVTDFFGPSYGVIEHGEDGWEILQDAARWLRNPARLEGVLGPVEGAEFVIGYGHSQTAAVLTGLTWSGENREADGSLVFDGMLLTGNVNGPDGLSCRILNDDDTPRDEPGRPHFPQFFEATDCLNVPEDGKVIVLRTQSDVEGRYNPLPYPAHNYRTYDLAGAAHVPEFMGGLRQIGATRQNPINWQPVARAMLLHLAEWIAIGEEPPPPVYIEGTLDAAEDFQIATDADGNALGGIRLPELTTILPSGERVGAALGVYGGRDPGLSGARGDGYASLGGTFAPFTPEELARRYPTREAYVDLVRRAAAALLEAGYILQDGYDSYVAAAKREPLPHLPTQGLRVAEPGGG